MVDSARAHHVLLVKEFLKEHEHKLGVLYLPPYSPELDPIECFWKYMRKTVSHNIFFKTFEEFLRALITFFRKFKFPSK